jgi:hypothetical protein
VVSTPERVAERATSTRVGLALLVAALLYAATGDAGATQLAAANRAEEATQWPAWRPGLAPSAQAPTATSWIAYGIGNRQRFCLSARSELRLLDRYNNPATSGPPAWQSYYLGRYGTRSWRGWPALTWDAGSGPSEATSTQPAPIARTGLRLHPLPDPVEPLTGGAALPTWAVAAQPVPAPQYQGVGRADPCPPWRQPRPVTLVRYGAEYDRFRLLECRGAIADGAIDRLSVIARPPGTARPELPLPLEPNPRQQDRSEWTAGVKLVHPRLVWVLQRFADAFPRRPIYIVSGYRRDQTNTAHRRGRALDLFVMGVSNEAAFRWCRRLPDVGCGFYPNHKFIHVDVRPHGSGHPMWIDVSEPGMPSHYVDGWPGLVDGGALRWAGEEK